MFPSNLKVAKEAGFTLEIKAQVDAPPSAAQAKLRFKQNLMRIVKIDPGTGWTASSSALQSAITNASPGR